MKLSKTQHRYLHMLLADGGGIATLEGLALRIGPHKTTTGAAISFLNLVAVGAVEGGAKDRTLRITDYGRRLLSPSP